MPAVIDWVRSAPARSAATLRRPDVHSDLLQTLKATLAAVAAWLLVEHVLDLEEPFLAPWTALLTVHATVYRSLSRGAQAMGATVLGVLLSATVAQLLGFGAVALGVAVALGLVLARVGVLRDEGVAVATTALFVLTTSTAQGTTLLDRVLATVVGVAVGVLVNLLVVPPLTDRSAEERVDRIDRLMGRLLQDMARQMRSRWNQEDSQAWITRTRDMDSELDDAWALVNQATESGWWNPRRHFSSGADELTSHEELLTRLEDGVVQARSMARTIDQSTRSAAEWDPRFREPWLDILEELGRRIVDKDAEVCSLRTDLDQLTQHLSGQDLPGLLWPVYGALLVSIGNVIEVVDDVATSRAVRTD